uniref:Calponin-homology (CH) domain-containing protein n=1 Tax=Fagus sylvatica TaxID=28930 RepID=A0A2N9H9R6_FAGSY
METPQSSSSSSSSESSFRELDDVFLQTQTRIWLGEVLQIRLDEQMTISDLLADGELLFEVSKVVWKMLLTNHRELRHVKAYRNEPFASRRSSGRYMPYSNVDSFLKICKILGLTGIDIFSPSDVVEKRDTRKVPDFDIVTYTVAMPTDMVGCIRRSWELPKCSFLNSASYDLYKDSREKFRQKHTIANSGRNYDMHLEDSDGTEINHMLDIQNQEKSDYSHCQFESPCTTESVGSLCTQHGECDHPLNSSLSTSSIDSQIHLSGRASPLRSQVKHSNVISAMDVIYDNCSPGYSAFVVEDSINDYTPSQSYFADQLHGTDSSDPVLYNASSSIDSHGSNSTPRIFESGPRRRLADMFDGVEVSSAGSMSSVSGAVLNLDSEDRFDTEDDSKIAQFPEFQNEKAVFLTKKTTRGYKSHDIVKYETRVDSLTSDSEKAHFCMELEDHGSSTKLFLPYPVQLNVTGHQDHVVSYDNGVCMSLVHSDVYDKEKLSQIDSDALKNVDRVLPSQSHFPFDFDKWDLKGKCATAMILNESAGHGASLVSVSEEVSLEETLLRMPTKALGDAFWLEDMKSIVGDNDKLFSSIVVNLDPNAKNQRDRYSREVHLNNILDGTYDDSIASPNTVAGEASEKCSALSSIEDGSCLQNQDIIGNIGGRVKCMSDMATVDNSAVQHNSVILSNLTEPTLDEDFCLAIECSENVGGKGHQSCTSLKDPFYCSEHIDKDDGIDGKVPTLGVEDLDGTKHVGEGTPECKPHKRLLLKSVVGGTAAFGFLFLMFRHRGIGRAKGGESNIESSQIWKTNGGKSSSQREGRANGIYPAEKLKFGD